MPGQLGTIDFGHQLGTSGPAEVRRRQERLIDILGSTNADDRSELIGILTNRQGLGGKDRNIARNITQIGRAGVLAEGFRVGDENDARRQEAKKFLLGNFAENTGPSITAEDIDRMFAADADRATEFAEGDLDFLRGHLGAAGITGGGLAAGLGTNIELKRLGQVTNARRDLRIFKAQQDAQDALRNLQFGQNVAGFLAQEADETRLAVMSEVLGVDLTVLGRELSHKEARDLANAQERSAAIGVGGQLIGAGIGAL